MIECQVSDGISKAAELLERAVSGDAPVYHAAAGDAYGGTVGKEKR